MATLARVRTTFTGVGGMPAYNNTYWGYAAPADATAAANAMGAFWYAVAAFQSNSVRYTVDPNIFLFDDTTGDVTGSVAGPVVTGLGREASAQNLPFSTQGLLRLRTGQYVGGREIRGRIFIPAMTEANNLGGLPDPNLVNNLNGAAATMAAAAPGLRVFSPTLLTSRSVTGTSMWNNWASLRSRRD